MGRLARDRLAVVFRPAHGRGVARRADGAVVAGHVVLVLLRGRRARAQAERLVHHGRERVVVRRRVGVGVCVRVVLVRVLVRMIPVAIVVVGVRVRVPVVLLRRRRLIPLLLRRRVVLLIRLVRRVLVDGVSVPHGFLRRHPAHLLLRRLLPSRRMLLRRPRIAPQKINLALNLLRGVIVLARNRLDLAPLKGRDLPREVAQGVQVDFEALGLVVVLRGDGAGLQRVQLQHLLRGLLVASVLRHQ